MTYWPQGAPTRPEARQFSQPGPVELRFLTSSRARLRFALFGSIAIAALLAFVVFPPRRLHVTADGHAVEVVSREQNVAAVLDSAGVKRDAGDVLVKRDNQITLERAVPVLVDADGRTLSLRTLAGTVGDLFNQLGIDIGANDDVFYDGARVGLDAPVAAASPDSTADHTASDQPVAPATISVVRAVPVTMVEDGRVISIETTDKTLDEVINDAGINLGPADEISPAPSAPVVAGMHVDIRHAKAITLHVGNSTRVIYTQKTTLADALADAGLKFNHDDRVEPALDAAVTDGMEARLVRVDGETYSEREPVKHATVFKPDDSLTGIQTRRVEGSDGSLVTEYKLTIEDGVETDREFSRQYFDPEPQDTVIYYASSSLQGSGLAPGTLTLHKTMRMYATWYDAASAGKAPGSGSYGVTASGMALARGIVAVDPSVIPLGTHLFIPGYGFAVAEDTGGGIVGNRIDLGFPDGTRVDWTTGWTDVYILTP